MAESVSFRSDGVEDKVFVLQTLESVLDRGNGEYFRGNFIEAIQLFHNMLCISEAILEEPIVYEIVKNTIGLTVKCHIALGNINALNEMKENASVSEFVFHREDHDRQKWLSPTFLDAIKHSVVSTNQKRVILTWLQQTGFCADTTMEDVERFDFSLFYNTGTSEEDLWRPMDELTSASIPTSAVHKILDEVALKTNPSEVFEMYEALQSICKNLIDVNNYSGASKAFLQAGMVLEAATRRSLELEEFRPGLLLEHRYLSVLCSVAIGDAQRLFYALHVLVISLDMRRISDILKRSQIPLHRKRFCIRILSHHGFYLDNSEILEIIGPVSGLTTAQILYTDGCYSEAIRAYTVVLEKVSSTFPPSKLAVIYYNRGSAHVALDQREAAIYDLQKTLELNPDHEKAKTKLRNLQQVFPKSDNESPTLDIGNHGNDSQVEQSVPLQTARSPVRSTEAIYYILGYKPLN